MSLGRKQSSKNEDWIEAWNNCKELISKEHIDRLTEETIGRIKSVIRNKDYRRIGYAWSGGKDSIVLYDILKKSKIRLIGGILALYEHEFPEFLEWLFENKPLDCRVVYTHAFTDEYINKHPEVLFPIEKKWKDAYLPPRWKVQNQFIEGYKLDCLILGRRIADGNNCGKKEDGYITTSKNIKCDKFNPIADWTHEEILAYIRHNDLELPPIYFYENGFQGGTQLWTEKRRINGYYFDTFDLLMSIDKRIILQSRGRIDLVDEYFKYKLVGGTKK